MGLITGNTDREREIREKGTRKIDVGRKRNETLEVKGGEGGYDKETFWSVKFVNNKEKGNCRISSYIATFHSKTSS